MAETDKIALEMGRRISTARELKSWTQADLAKATGWTQEDADHGKARGLSPSRIGNYEQGERRVPHEAAEILGKLFALPGAYFLVTVDLREAQVLKALREQRAADPPPEGTTRRQAAKRRAG